MESEAIPYLEELQKKEFEKHGYPLLNNKNIVKRIQKKYIKDIIKKEGKNLAKKEKKEFKKTVKNHYNSVLEKKQLTKYENPLFIEILDHLNEVIVDGFKNIHFTSGDIDIRFDKMVEFIKKPILGTLPSGNVNAHVRSFTKTNEYLIIFENELFIFCNQISKIVAKALPFKEEKKIYEWKGKTIPRTTQLTFGYTNEEIDESLEQKPDVFEKFAELFIAYLIEGRPSISIQYNLEYPYSHIADNIRDGMEIFILAHEYSHIHMEHVGDLETKSVSISRDDVKKILYSWDQEFQADQGGLLLTIGAMMVKQWDVPLSYWGIEIFFFSQEYVERGICILKHGHDDFYWRDGRSDGPLGSHPPAERRKEALRKIFSEEQKGDLNLAKAGERILQKLWVHTKTKLIEHYNQKNALNKRWTSSIED